MAIIRQSGIPADFFNEVDTEAPLTTDSFHATADLAEGHSGVRKIDSTYENDDYELLRGEVNEAGGDK